MSRAPHLWLIDSPLFDNQSPRLAMVEQMANALVREQAMDIESDAIRSLHGAGFQMADIVMCIDDARQAAMQHIVAREMAKL